MKGRLPRALNGIALGILAAGIALLTTSAWATDPYKVLFNFAGSDGAAPDGNLIFDHAGNLYGTTSAGGANGYGTVFKLSPGTNGSWTETVLHNFDRNSGDGTYPEGGLIFDSAGNLYGTTSEGGADGNGTVFELSPGTNGSWAETVLFSLNGADGAAPFGSLTFDTHGNLYGTAWQGGKFTGNCLYGGCGTVFKLSPVGNGKWTGTAIHVFNGTDGSGPFCNVIFDKAGNLYGTTTGLLSNYRGTVFELTPRAKGQWTEKVLYMSNGRGDEQFYAGLVFDKAGSLYGTTWSGGAYFVGSVIKLTPGQNGKWSRKVLHSFNTKDGSFTYAGVLFDAAGNLWGTTSGYGSDLGSVYELTPGPGGHWNINVLQTFVDMQVNGGVLLDAAGNVFSTALHGGNGGACEAGCGVVFEVTP